MLRSWKRVYVLLLFLVVLSACTEKKGDRTRVLISRIQDNFAPDQRNALFRVEPVNESGELVLKGETSVPEAHKALLDSLKESGVSIIDSIALLPDSTVGNSPWGLVTLSVGNLRSGPDHAGEMVSQLLLGTPVKILKRSHGWFLIQSPDQYIGWIDDSALFPVSDRMLNEWKSSNRYFYNRISGSVYVLPDEKGPVVSDLVLGALFYADPGNGEFMQVHFPDGRTGYVKKNECTPFQEWGASRDVGKIIGTARLLLGRPYLWGGTSTKGTDCSGLIKTAYFSQGVILARDASQQVRYGVILPVTDALDFLPGDLLFFGRSKEHVTHVGMYTGNGKYIHSSGLVRINSLDPKDPDYLDYNRKRLVAASRVLNSLGTEEIVPVQQHPWYVHN